MSRDQFPLTRQLGLSIGNALAVEEPKATPGGYFLPAPIQFVRAADLESLLSKAAVVYDQNSGGFQIWSKKQFDHSTHTALLVNVQPIVRDTAEGLLREFIKIRERPHADDADELDCLEELKNRARALLAKGD